ncbi:MAG: carnitine 3-dehydrogenase [Paracoccaceae bacterium]|nr:carnitine 3-dehydrogenase [Paracoccaceae bacterium]
MNSSLNLLNIACIGCGVIGAGWIARFIENGVNVSIFDPGPKAELNVKRTLENAETAYANLTSIPRIKKGTISFKKSINEAVKNVDLIIESVPERVDIKQKVYSEIEQYCDKSTLITSSTSGIMPSELQKNLKSPDRFYVGHPFNPVYLLPLVEIVGGRNTSKATISRAKSIYKQIGMHPVHIKKEIDAFVADRLLEAIWRESLWLIKDGICTTAELDDIVRFGFGLRYAQMGVFDTYRVAGGDAGMRHFMAQFGPCLKWPWTKLMNVPEFNAELVELISSQSDEQSGHLNIREMERLRDSNLIEILKGLKKNNWGAGKNLRDYEASLKAFNDKNTSTTNMESNTIKTLKTRVPSDWVDYNGHMNEARYLDCFCEATDQFMKIIGCDADYVKKGGSYFTVETHIRHMAETKIGESLSIETQLISGTGKKMHLFHTMRNSSNVITATGEHMLIHVSLKTRSASEPSSNILKNLSTIFNRHSKLPWPKGLGNAINNPKPDQSFKE